MLNTNVVASAHWEGAVPRSDGCTLWKGIDKGYNCNYLIITLILSHKPVFLPKR